MSALDKIIAAAEASGWTIETSSADHKEMIVLREGARLRVALTSAGSVQSAVLLVPGQDAQEIGTREAGKLARVLEWVAEEAPVAPERPAWWLASREVARARAAQRIESARKAAEAQLSRRNAR